RRVDAVVVGAEDEWACHREKKGDGWGMPSVPVEATGFEPATPRPPVWCATRLRYASGGKQGLLDRPGHVNSRGRQMARRKRSDRGQTVENVFQNLRGLEREDTARRDEDRHRALRVAPHAVLLVADDEVAETRDL